MENNIQRYSKFCEGMHFISRTGGKNVPILFERTGSSGKLTTTWSSNLSRCGKVRRDKSVYCCCVTTLRHFVGCSRSLRLMQRTPQNQYATAFTPPRMLMSDSGTNLKLKPFVSSQVCPKPRISWSEKMYHEFLKVLSRSCMCIQRNGGILRL